MDVGPRKENWWIGDHSHSFTAYPPSIHPEEEDMEGRSGNRQPTNPPPIFLSGEEILNNGMGTMFPKMMMMGLPANQPF